MRSQQRQTRKNVRLGPLNPPGSGDVFDFLNVAREEGTPEETVLLTEGLGEGDVETVVCAVEKRDGRGKTLARRRETEKGKTRTDENDQAVGSPTNRINILAHHAAAGLALHTPSSSFSPHTLKSYLSDKFRLAVFKVVLFAVDVGFLWTRVASWIAERTGRKGEGLEDLLQRQVMKETTKAEQQAGLKDRLKNMLESEELIPRVRFFSFLFPFLSFSFFSFQLTVLPPARTGAHLRHPGDANDARRTSFPPPSFPSPSRN